MLNDQFLLWLIMSKPKADNSLKHQQNKKKTQQILILLKHKRLCMTWNVLFICCGYILATNHLQSS